jgi:hypothetical protein
MNSVSEVPHLVLNELGNRIGLGMYSFNLCFVLDWRHVHTLAVRHGTKGSVNSV